MFSCSLEIVQIWLIIRVMQIRALFIYQKAAASSCIRLQTFLPSNKQDKRNVMTTTSAYSTLLAFNRICNVFHCIHTQKSPDRGVIKHYNCHYNNGVGFNVGITDDTCRY